MGHVPWYKAPRTSPLVESRLIQNIIAWLSAMQQLSSYPPPCDNSLQNLLCKKAKEVSVETARRPVCDTHLPESTQKAHSWRHMIAIPALGSYRQVDLWGYLASQSSLS